MLLTFDLGNSRLKFALWQNESVVYTRALDWQHASELRAVLAERLDSERIDAVTMLGVTSVERLQDVAACVLELGLPVARQLQVTATCCGVTHAYDDPASHGADRWAAVIAAHHLYDGTVCIIDAGSAITVDVVTAGGQHLGGCIAPGSGIDQGQLFSRFGARSTPHTGALLADNTPQAVAAGCAAFAEGGVTYIVSRIRDEVGQDMRLVLTGGDADQVLGELGSTAQAIVEPHLVMHGLRIFSETN